MRRYDPSYYYYNVLESSEINNFSTIISSKKEDNNNNNNNNNNNGNKLPNDEINNDSEMNNDEFMFISYITVTQKGLLQGLANVLGDPEILDDDPQIMDSILEWYTPCHLFFSLSPPPLLLSF